MTTVASNKDPGLLVVLEALTESLGDEAFRVIDHWSDDPQAIGVASPSNEGLLAYIAVYPEADEQYFVALEFPPAGEESDHPYTAGDDRNVCNLEEVLAIVARHLGVTSDR